MKVKCPVYIVHGTNDEVISYSHAEDLVRNCQEGIAYPPYLVENGGHNNLEAGAGELKVGLVKSASHPWVLKKHRTKLPVLLAFKECLALDICMYIQTMINNDCTVYI